MTEAEKKRAEVFFDYKNGMPNGTGFALMEVAFVNGKTEGVYYQVSGKPTFIERIDAITEPEKPEQKAEDQ